MNTNNYIPSEILDNTVWKNIYTEKFSKKIINILYIENELNLKLKYITENPWYSDEMDYMSLWSDLSEKNIKNYLILIINLDISKENLDYIIEWIIYSNKSTITTYTEIINLNNEIYNSIILDKIFVNIKNNKSTEQEKNLFINILKNNSDINLFSLRNFLKEKSETRIENSKEILEQVLIYLPENIKSQVSKKINLN